MKKIFLIPLMTLMSCVLAFATVRMAGTFAELQSALTAAVDGDEIQLTADINYSTGTSVAFSVSKNVTIDGQGHTISGSGKCVFSVQGTSAKHVTAAVFKNLKLNNSTGRVFQLYDYLDRVDIDNCELGSQGGSNIGSPNPEVITPWSDTGQVELNLTNSKISATNSGYPIIIRSPLMLNATNSFFEGYCSLYFKNGSRGSVVNADACNFDCPNVHSGESNAFSCFPLEDDGITLNLHNCGMNIEQVGDQNQALVTIGNTSTARHENPINITLSGDNSHFNTKGGLNKCIQNLWIQNTASNKVDLPLINVTIEGGTYSVNPIPTAEEYSAGQAGMLYYGQWQKDGDGNYTGSVTLWGPTIPDGYEVSKVQQDGVTLYRVHKSASSYVDPVSSETVLYDLNDNVENIAAGENPVTSFELSTGAEMALNQETTTAGYVQVKNSDSADPATATVVKVGKTETVGSEEQKVDQVLYISQGLDVLEDAKVEVQAGSALVIGDGGITTSSEESIVLGADKDGCASLLLHPDIEVNSQPELTIKMTAEGVGMQDVFGTTVRHWHRFALPITAMADNKFEAKAPNYPTAVKSWDYTTNTWGDVADLRTMEPFYGYMLSTTQPVEDVTYTFKGQLVGNQNSTIQFAAKGYNFFGNSYTGYISVLNLVDMLVGKSNIEGTVWLWNGTGYTGVPLLSLQESPEDYAGLSEVAPMQTFVLRLRSNDLDAVDVNYAEAIWGNPRYSAFTGVAAPALRGATSSDKGMMDIIVTDMEGHSDVVRFMEKSTYTDSEDRGYDASKLMNNGYVQMYSTVSGENYSTVASDNLVGKKLSIRSLSDYQYTITFAHVRGLDYALRDNVTGAVTPIVEGNMYSFVSQPNSTAAGRFEIVPVRTMPTVVENAEEVPVVKGIYSMQGQYLGNDLSVLPAGVYVVDGVRIVK